MESGERKRVGRERAGREVGKEKRLFGRLAAALVTCTCQASARRVTHTGRYLFQGLHEALVGPHRAPAPAPPHAPPSRPSAPRAPTRHRALTSPAPPVSQAPHSTPGQARPPALFPATPPPSPLSSHPRPPTARGGRCGAAHVSPASHGGAPGHVAEGVGGGPGVALHRVRRRQRRAPRDPCGRELYTAAAARDTGASRCNEVPARAGVKRSTRPVPRSL